MTKVLVRIEDEVSPELLAILLLTVGHGVIRTYTDNASFFEFSEQKLEILRGFLEGKIKPASPSEASDSEKSSGYSSDEGIKV